MLVVETLWNPIKTRSRDQPSAVQPPNNVPNIYKVISHLKSKLREHFEIVLAIFDAVLESNIMEKSGAHARLRHLHAATFTKTGAKKGKKGISRLSCAPEQLQQGRQGGADPGGSGCSPVDEGCEERGLAKQVGKQYGQPEGEMRVQPLHDCRCWESSILPQKLKKEFHQFW